MIFIGCMQQESYEMSSLSGLENNIVIFNQIQFTFKYYKKIHLFFTVNYNSNLLIEFCARLTKFIIHRN